MKLHPSTCHFSPVACGFWRLHEWGMSTSELIRFIEECLEAGITTFDHADIYGGYGNEELFGKALAERPDLREKMQLVSKCGIALLTQSRPEHRIAHYNTTKKWIRSAAERSLRKLQTERLDLLLIHRPDPLMDAAEVADTLSALVAEEKVAHVGVSNFSPSQFDLLQSKMDLPLVTNQVEFSLLHTQPMFDGTFDQAQNRSVTPMVWSPFAGGELFTSTSQQAGRVRSVLHQLSLKYDAAMDQIALAWIRKLPGSPLPVVGTGRTDRIRGAAGSLAVTLERQDWYLLLQASMGHPVP